MERRDFLKLSAAALGAAAGGVRAEAPRGAGRPTGTVEMEPSRIVKLFLSGDVMTGRGIDQVLPHPGPPAIFEAYMRSARGYVQLAERANGPIPRPADFDYVWGDALAELERAAPDARIVNLETAVTRSDDRAPKGINYRMHPGNVACLTAAKLDCCVLANNHVLDWGRAGLEDTLATLEAAGIGTAGAGRTRRAAEAPWVLPLGDRGRVLVFAFGDGSSGIPPGWAAGDDSPGIDLLPDLSERTLRRIADRVRGVKRPGDVAVASIHWGGNWGHAIPAEHRTFAHGLIDRAAIDVVHGHSSHHPRGIEVHRGRPVLYGCGDLLNDYEGIDGNEEFRGDLALMYFVSMDAASGALARLEMTPLQVRRFRLNRASAEDAEWLRRTLDRECARFGGRVEPADGGRLALRWGRGAAP